MGQLLTLADLASRLRLSLATIQRMRAAGRLPAEIEISGRSIRFRLEDVEAWEAELRRSGGLGARPADFSAPAAVL